MQIALPELDSPVTITLDPEHLFSDEEYLAFCEANPDLRLERTSEGEIVIVPPAGMESDYQNARVIYQLTGWADRDRRGRAFGSSVEFFLPDGSALSPDASWVSHERLASVPREQLRRFPHLTPQFVVEVLSPSDRLAAAKRKMAVWMANGVELAWLIDGDKRTVYVYRHGGEVQVLSGIEQLSGEGPVEGFVLELKAIWEGL